jgi:hypothetical protein
VGYAENAELPLGAYTTFRGQAVDDTAILIAHTRTGDANLDGVVGDEDVTVLGATFAPGASQPAWALGDFEYNGSIDDADATLLGVFFMPAVPPAPAPLATRRPVVDEALMDLLAAAIANYSETRKPTLAVRYSQSGDAQTDTVRWWKGSDE